MFERFTDRARRVIVLSQEEARLLDHNYIGTEHILLGLVHEGEGVAARALRVAQRQPRGRPAAGRGDRRPGRRPRPYGHIPFTPRAKKVLELSLREALQLGHNYIGTEHILLGLVREGEGVACQVLPSGSGRGLPKVGVPRVAPARCADGCRPEAWRAVPTPELELPGARWP